MVPAVDAVPARPPAAVLTRALRATPALSSTARPRLRAGPAGVELHAGPRRQPPTVDPLGRGRTITGGAALRNVELAMAHLGHRSHTTLLPNPADPLHLATLGGTGGCDDECGAVPEARERRLYRAMARAATSREVFSARQLSTALAGRLHEAVVPDGNTRGIPTGVVVTVVTGNHLRTVGTVLAAAAGQVTRTPPAADEHDLADVEHLLRRRPGTTAHPGVLLADQLGRGRLLLVTTPADSPTDWVRAGWAAQNVLLTAVDSGLLASVVGGVLDAPGVRATLADRFRLASCPQLLLRVGWAKATAPGDRRTRVDRPVEAGGVPLT